MNQHFARALIAFGEGDYAAAADLARLAAEEQPDSLVYPAAAAYLRRVIAHGRAGVYVTGDAFSSFIRGGGNLPLYANTSAALREAYAGYSHIGILDIGVGDGMALLPAITPQVVQIDLVEPSAPMLAQARAALDARGIAYRAFNGTIQQFTDEGGMWELAQATFSLQSLDRIDRQIMLAWLRGHCARLLIAEFDVPDRGDLYAPARMEYFVARYEVGLAEYADDGGLVAQGFLMPIFFGSFDRGAARTNYEQPIAAWEADLRAAGFARTQRRPIYDYWWAPAYLLDAT
ncbi:class I SAM-dependent methyltransferase [Oscillochloris sp. ZM17-4]|uniref:class I SAM-dependent methyltransferase n=1 Tax=Oscillochloris sp. ZM17-4 TaxID=2866714 RepID=UPI001C73391A|nr:class I SAM-dependent methyltransferase [Oscillochloris sp. ZM17-4]MBX0330811.1 class I SAM-dependent methyltransferase [Oscillochloris sp. ZM17-4]